MLPVTVTLRKHYMTQYHDLGVIEYQWYPTPRVGTLLCNNYQEHILASVLFTESETEFLISRYPKIEMGLRLTFTNVYSEYYKHEGFSHVLIVLDPYHLTCLCNNFMASPVWLAVGPWSL